MTMAGAAVAMAAEAIAAAVWMHACSRLNLAEQQKRCVYRYSMPRISGKQKERRALTLSGDQMIASAGWKREQWKRKLGQPAREGGRD